MNNPNCTFCNRDFSLSKIPYELPCGHSYCRNCLHSFCKKNENEIKCLKEEKLFILSISKVPISNFFINYIEPLRNNHLEKHIICRKHNNAQINFICDLHHDYLCSQCSWDHCDHKEKVRSYSSADFISELQELESKFFEMKQNLDDFMKKFAEIKEGQSFADEIKSFIIEANNVLKKPFNSKFESEHKENNNHISFLHSNDIRQNPDKIKEEQIEKMTEEIPLKDNPSNYIDLTELEKKNAVEDIAELDSEKLEKLDKKINNLKSHKGKIPVLISNFQLGQIPEHNLGLLCESIKNNNQIQIIGLNNNGFGAAKLANVEMVCEALQKRDNIIHLQLKANGFGEGIPKNMELFCNTICKFEKLMFLSMSNNKLCSGNIKNLELLCQIIGSSKQIKEFEFKYNDIGGAPPENIKVFCEAVQKNKSLFQIALDSNNLATGYIENFKQLADALKNNSSLRKISLSCNQLESIKSGEFNHHDENKKKTFFILKKLLAEKQEVEILLLE